MRGASSGVGKTPIASRHARRMKTASVDWPEGVIRTANNLANTARSIGAAPREIQLRHIGNCLKADPAYGRGVAEALGLAAPDLPAA